MHYEPTIRLLTPQDAADLLHVSPMHLTALLEQGVLHHVEESSGACGISLESVIEYKRGLSRTGTAVLAAMMQDKASRGEPVSYAPSTRFLH